MTERDQGIKGSRDRVVGWSGILTFASCILQFAVASTSPADLFGRGNAAYEAGSYQQAVMLYDSAAAGVTSADLFYNRGNSYFKLGEVGRAIADYNRAYVLKPHDKDISYNLAFARQYRPDKSFTIENPLVRMFTGVLRVPDVASARALAGLLFFLALGSLALLFIRGQRPFGWIALGLGVLFLYCLLSSVSWNAVTGKDHAVVVQPELTLRSGPGQEYKEIAVVHDGLEVTVREERPGYVLVQIPGGDGGWVESSSVERIFAR